MMIAYDVLAVYAALVVWSLLLLAGLRKRRFGPFLGWGAALLVFLNVRYFVEGPPAAVAFFVGIYDVFDNLGLSRDEGAPALARCVDNACTVWGDRFVNHPSWGVAFHERFLNGPESRAKLLYVHIAGNTVAFLIMHYQLLRPGGGASRARHALLGRLGFAAVALGTASAVALASGHGAVEAYGGALAEWGFYSMSALVFGAAAMTAVTARRGDVRAHRIWAIRYAGAMWGSFWLFRVMLVATGPLLRSWETASVLWSIWTSAPLGIVIAEVARRRLDRVEERVGAPVAPRS